MSEFDIKIQGLKGLCTFCRTKNTMSTGLHLNSHSLKIMVVESFPENITCRGAVVFEKWVKQCHENNFRLSDRETKKFLACKNVFS